MATAKAIHYFDSFGGLIPCRELYRGEQFSGIEITANRANYRKGEQITVSKFRVILRSQVYVKNGQYWIHADPSHI